MHLNCLSLGIYDLTVNFGSDVHITVLEKGCPGLEGVACLLDVNGPCGLGCHRHLPDLRTTCMPGGGTPRTCKRAYPGPF